MKIKHIFYSVPKSQNFDQVLVLTNFIRNISILSSSGLNLYILSIIRAEHDYLRYLVAFQNRPTREILNLALFEAQPWLFVALGLKVEPAFNEVVSLPNSGTPNR